MTRKIVRSQAAVDDLLLIIDDLLVGVGVEPALAAEARLDAAIESLDELANRGRVVPELRARGIVTYREFVAMPYRILYRVEATEVWIVAVLDHRRDLAAILHERARRDQTRSGRARAATIRSSSR